MVKHHRTTHEEPERRKRDQDTIARWAIQQYQKKLAQKATSQPTPAPQPNQPMKAEELEKMRVTARMAFLTHPAATEEDFERCWPLIRDDMFKLHTLKVLTVLQTHDENLSDIEAAFQMFIAEYLESRE